MQNGKGTTREKELLAATDVAGMIGVKETTVYRWCKEGKLPCLKVGKHWRIRREALEDFLRQSERPRTLVGQLNSFLRVPDSVLAIAQNIDILHRLDAAFFRVGESQDGLLVKFYAGKKHSEEELLSDFEENGLQAWRLKREGRVVVITGASRGIGRVTARLFAEGGAWAARAARSEGALLEAAAECESLGGRALAVPTDVADWKAVERLARRTVEHFCRIDVWVNNAVLVAVGRLENVPPDANRRVVEANLLGYVYGAQAVLPPIAFLM